MEQTCAHPENADSAHATVFGQGPVLGLPDRAGELWVSLGLVRHSKLGCGQGCS